MMAELPAGAAGAASRARTLSINAAKSAAVGGAPDMMMEEPVPSGEEEDKGGRGLTG